MKNVKTEVFCLIVGTIAISISSFTFKKNHTPGAIYINNGDGTYTSISASNYDSMNCTLIGTAPCSYEHIGGTFAETIDISVIIANSNDFIQEGTETGVYQP